MCNRRRIYAESGNCEVVSKFGVVFDFILAARVSDGARASRAEELFLATRDVKKKDRRCFWNFGDTSRRDEATVDSGEEEE
jgi:hypothetical protein